MGMKRFKVLNYAMDESVRLLTESEVPTLVPSDKLAAIQNGDGAPYYKIQAIKYPIRGSGGIYEESFFESFVNVTSSRPIPGAKRGHWRGSRPESDFYMVGGKLEKNGDGTGTVYFKNYIPPEGDGTNNSRFIQDAKAGIVNFSLVSYPGYTVDENGMYHFTSSNGGERNDAVEYGLGAMKQQTNSQEEADVLAMLKAGKVDKTSAWVEAQDEDDAIFYRENQIGKSGKIYRSALRSLAARGPETGATELLAIMDGKGEKMNKAEMLTALANMRTNGELTNVELASAFGLKLENAEELTRLKTENAALQAKVNETETVRLNAFLDKEFGTQGLLRDYAGKMLNSLDQAKVDEFRKDPVALQLAGMQADVTFFGKVDNKQKDAAKIVGGVAIVEV